MGSASALGCLGGRQPRLVYAPTARCQSHHYNRVTLPLQETRRTEHFQRSNFLLYCSITGNRATATHHRRRSFHPGGGWCRKPRFSSL